MDSVSQFVLGAAVGGAVLGHRVGSRALLLGGVVATLPDLDVFLPLGDAVSNFTYHRSASHSLFVLTLITPILAWLLRRLHPGADVSLKSWSWFVWLILVTHVLLDCFTIYGTQIFWPLAAPPVGWGTIFIIDPLYTVPLLVAVLGAFIFLRQQPARVRRWSVVGLALSSAYLAFTLGAKVHVNHVVTSALQRQQIAYGQFMTVPTFFNTILWRTVVMTDEGYLEGFYSLADPEPEIRFRHYDSQPELLAPVQDAWAVQRLDWFTRGFYRVRAEDNFITVTDLRMGQEPFYVFSFVVAKQDQGEIREVPNERFPQPSPAPQRLSEIWERIFTGPDYEMQL